MSADSGQSPIQSVSKVGLMDTLQPLVGTGASIYLDKILLLRQRAEITNR